MANGTAQKILAKYHDGDLYGAARDLRDIQQNKRFSAWGHTNFRDFLATLGYRSYRKWMFLIEVINRADELGYSAAEQRKLLRGLGQTKVRVMLNLMDRKRSADALISRYKDRSVPQIETDLMDKPMENFTARISKKNAERLYRVLAKHGMRNNGRQKRQLGQAFDQFLSKSL